MSNFSLCHGDWLSSALRSGADDDSGDEEDESDGPAAQAAAAQAPSRRLSLQRDASAGHRRSRSSLKVGHAPLCMTDRFAGCLRQICLS